MTYVTLVCGPPCSGKTSYVAAEAKPGDVVVDWDALAVALGSPDDHDHPEELVPFIAEARDAVVARFRRRNRVARAYIIASAPTDLDKYAWQPDRVVELDVSAEECKRRADEAGRPSWTHDAIERWWNEHGWT